MQHQGRQEAAAARASGFDSPQAASVMGMLKGISASATKKTQKQDLRAEVHAAKVERARARREEKRRVQQRREVVDELVGLIRDDATPSALALCGGQRSDERALLTNPTIEDVVRDSYDSLV